MGYAREMTERIVAGGFVCNVESMPLKFFLIKRYKKIIIFQRPQC